MINNEITTTKGMESAQKALEQAKNRVAVERRKANAERRKFEDHHKYMMGGTAASPTTDTERTIALSTESSLIPFPMLSLMKSRN